jgi:hypothetical protein
VEKNNLTLPSELHSITDQETFTKARLYATDKSKFSFISSIYGHVEGMVSLWNIQNSLDMKQKLIKKFFKLILTNGAIPFLWNLCGSQLTGLESEWMKSEVHFIN